MTCTTCISSWLDFSAEARNQSVGPPNCRKSHIMFRPAVDSSLALQFTFPKASLAWETAKYITFRAFGKITDKTRQNLKIYLCRIPGLQGPTSISWNTVVYPVTTKPYDIDWNASGTNITVRHLTLRKLILKILSEEWISNDGLTSYSHLSLLNFFFFSLFTGIRENQGMRERWHTSLIMYNIVIIKR